MLGVMYLDVMILRLDPTVTKLIFKVLQLSILVASHFFMASKSHSSFDSVLLVVLKPGTVI